MRPSPATPVRPVRRRRRRKHAVALGRIVIPLVVTLTLLAGCTLGPSQRPALATFGTPQASTGSTGASTLPLGPGGPGRQADPIQWQPCSDVDSTDPGTGLTFQVDCAELLVDRKSLTSFGDQALQVARARAPGVASDAPAVVALLGAAGENGRDQVAAVAASLSPAVRDRFAVITLDLSGTGHSGAIDCLDRRDKAELLTLGTDPTEPASSTVLAELARSLTFECGDLAGPQLSMVNTTVATDDLDALRDAMGVPTLNLIGRGFGATLIAVYADRYPGRVGTAVLDGPSDPLEPLDARAAAVAIAAERSLDRFAASCAAFEGGCPLGADPKAAVTAAISTLDSAPGAEPGSGQPNGGTVLLSLLLHLGDPVSWPRLAAALAAAANGDSTQVDGMVGTALGRTGSTGWPGPTLIYSCNDSALRMSPDLMATAVEAVRPEAPILGPYTVGLVGLCSSWPAPEAALGAVKATGAPPILVLGAVDDPVAPYSAVRSLAGQLDSATLVSWQSGQHGSYPDSACVVAAVDAYLLAGELPAVGTLCPP